jgi:hypothetical protein
VNRGVGASAAGTAIAVVGTSSVDAILRAVFGGKVDGYDDRGLEEARKRVEVAKVIALAQMFENIPSLMEFSRKVLSGELQVGKAQVEFATFVLGRLLPDGDNSKAGVEKGLEAVMKNWYGADGSSEETKGIKIKG